MALDGVRKYCAHRISLLNDLLKIYNNYKLGDQHHA